MKNYIDDLPEELINRIYMMVFCDVLKEIKEVCTCTMCENIIYTHSKYYSNYGVCKNCNRPVCYNCWTGYCTNYGRGWKPCFGFCQECAIIGIRNFL